MADQDPDTEEDEPLPPPTQSEDGLAATQADADDDAAESPSRPIVFGRLLGDAASASASMQLVICGGAKLFRALSSPCHCWRGATF